MNILLLSQFFSTTRGGGEYVFNIIAKNLAKNGHNVYIITNKIHGEKYQTHQNINLIFIPPTLEYKGGLPPSFSDNIRYTINAVKTGLDTIKKEKIDIIHSNNFAPALAGSILSTISSKPHITTIHDIFSLCGKNYWKQWGKQSDISRLNVFLAPFFEKLSVKLRYSCIHTVSEATKDDLIKFGAKKPIHVIHNAVETTSHSNTPTNPFQFVYIGRLVFYKNLEVIIKAIDIIKKTEPKINLVIIGSGPHKQTLQKMVQDLDLQQNIEFQGYVSPEEKSKTLETSNALVFPSLCEGFGLVILESFEKSRPVLVSDIRPMSDIVSHKQNGLVLDPHDENIWAKSMLELIHDPEMSSKMGESANQLLKTRYSQDALYKKIIEMYNATVKLD
ncbi:MAG: glycosyltransferase family 4 protein [Nitrososphaera sp.]